MNPILRDVLRYFVTVAALVGAFFVARWMWNRYEVEPWTRDARLRADVIQVAPDVSGPVASVEVRDNQPVERGQVLFVIDRARFELALAQAESQLASLRSEAAQAEREARRSRSLGQAIPVETREQSLARLEQARATLERATADRNLAALDLERSVVRSPVTGTVTNVLLQAGDYVKAGQQTMAVVDSSTFRVEAYFEETKLSRIAPGDPVTIHVMGESPVLRGHVESIAAGIEDRERTVSSSLLPDVNPTFSWVRLAQRIPVRIAFDEVPGGLRLIVGRTATVNVFPREDRQ